MRNLLTLIISCLFLSLSQSLYSQRVKDIKYEGMQYPEFSITSVNGSLTTSKQLEGKITLINLWHHQCSPCIAEMDALEDIYNEFKHNPSFLFISITTDPDDIAKKSVEKYKLPYPVFPVSQKEGYILNLRNGFPTTIVIDRTGKIIHFQCGGPIDKKASFKALNPIKMKIKELLSE